MFGIVLVAYVAFGSVAHFLDTAAKDRIAERARMPEVSEYRAVVTRSCALMDETEIPCGSPLNRSADKDRGLVPGPHS